MLRIALALYALFGLGCLFQGGRYLLGSEVMPYHLQLLGASWSELEPGLQALLLGLLKGFGAGSLVVGAAIAALTMAPARSRTGWLRLTLALLSIGYGLLLIYVTHTSLLPGAPPQTVSLVFGLIAVVATVLMHLAYRSKSQ